MKKQTVIILLVSIIYAVIAYLLYELVVAMLGHHSIVWGDMFKHLSIKLQEFSLYVYLLLGVLYVLMIMHVVQLTSAIKRQPESVRINESEMSSVTPPTVTVRHRKNGGEEASRPAPELCLSYWDKNGQEGENLRMTFAELRSRGGLTLGQSGHSNLSFGDASMALRHAELSLTPDGHLSITHLPSGVPNSMRVNGRNLDLGQSMNIEGMAELYLGATHIVIRTR